MCSSSGGPDFKDVAKAQIASILDGVAQTTISEYVWAPTGLLVYKFEWKRVKKYVETIKSDSRQSSS